jgi:hypothetical protein
MTLLWAAEHDHRRASPSVPYLPDRPVPGTDPGSDTRPDFIRHGPSRRLLPTVV